jgi:UDP-glucose 4-epimerase
VTHDGLEGRTALVTGASGFIGGHLLARLSRSGVEVHAVSRRPPAGDVRAQWHTGDLADFDAVRRVVSSTSPNLVFHLAGDPRASRALSVVLPTFSANLVSTVNLLTAIAESNPAARVVLTGSLEEPTAGDVTASSPYAASKLAARSYGRLFNETMGLAVIVLRVFMVYGPRQKDVKKLVPYVILSLLRGERPQLASGSRAVDWVYVEDVVDAFIAAAATADVASASVDVGSGSACSIKSLVERLVEMIDPRIKPEFGAIADRALEQVRVADIEAAAAAIGWRPQVGLDDGLTRTVRWYREQLERGLA